jgi:hypothetical protein
MEQVATTILSAMLGSVIVAFVAPWIQHHFWKRQRYAELCLLRIDQVAKASNKFISSVRRWHDEKEKWQRERIEFFLGVESIGYRSPRPSVHGDWEEILAL